MAGMYENTESTQNTNTHNHNHNNSTSTIPYLSIQGKFSCNN